MELPLRLLVAAVVVGLTVPAIHGGLNAYETAQASRTAEVAIDAVVRVAQRLYLSGGGAQDVVVDLSGGVTARVEYVRIGDTAGGPRAPSAVYKVSGAPERFLLAEPPVPMAGEAGPLDLGPGHTVVRVSYDGEGPVRLAVP
ncbi:MAG TPA: hypothetical protein VJ400_04940 [Thermoplasmata archaeon]|nr:hypothetical protein [Thermoplasmata archaeon]